ncbi:MAG: hypothetical protein O3B04_07000 [Chloroflexi bacterium]|nr:hypothetical protein [Chloroflexota bacterium]MDA1297728.1 hypothetical protein [Chloroflexota bacterium]
MVLNNVSFDRVRPFIVASIATIIALVAATMATSGWASAQGIDGTGPGGTGPTPTPVPTVVPTPDVPPGQMVRRGLSGEVVSVSDSGFVVETRHGNVLVLVNDATVIKQPPDGEVDLSAVQVGGKVGVLLAKPAEDDATPSDGTTVFRTATALKVVIVPTKATREHKRAVVLEKIKDALKNRVKFLNRDGDEVEIETEVEIEGEEGEEVILITRKGKHGEDERVSSSARAEEIEERLRKLAGQREELEAKLEEVREQYNASRAELLEKARDRVANLEIGDEIKARIDEASARAHARVDEARTIAQARIDEARVKAQERIDEARGKALDRLEDAVANSDRLTDEQREKAQQRLDQAGTDADARVKKAREDAEKRIKQAREDAEKRISNSREQADDRIKDAREQAQKRLEEARKQAEERRNRQSDDGDAGDGVDVTPAGSTTVVR